MEINGIAHIVLTVSNFETAVPFYEELLAFLGMKCVFKGEEFLYYLGGKTGLAISKCDELYRQEQFVQRRVGLHHLCFRARERREIDSFYSFLQELGAFSIPESYLFFYVCDLAFNMGFAENVEFGPGRHGPGHALFVYMRDPDGHRIELFNTHYQCIDIEDEPVRWDASVAGKRRWQLPARARWYTQASRFAGVEPREPAHKGNPMTLENYVGAAG